MLMETWRAEAMALLSQERAEASAGSKGLATANAATVG